MKYAVLIADQALEQLEAAYLWLAARTQMHAPTWYNGMLDAIDSLEESPLRCSRVPEEEDFGNEARQLLHGATPHTYRIIFVVRGSTVNVIAIFHGARDLG